MVNASVFCLHRYLWAISMAKEEGRQVNCKAVLPIDVTKECCSVRDIQSSFAKLMDIVIPGLLVRTCVYLGLWLVAMATDAYRASCLLTLQGVWVS